jgi:hypothetical protein
MDKFPIYSSAPDELARAVLATAAPGTAQYVLAVEYLALFDEAGEAAEADLLAEYENGYSNGRTSGLDDARIAALNAARGWGREAGLDAGTIHWLTDTLEKELAP